MPQEIVVPIVTVKHIRGKSALRDEDQAGNGPSAWQQPPDHQCLLPLPVDSNGACERSGETDYAKDRHSMKARSLGISTSRL